ncbi:MAG: DUF2817 domain-containing protein [Symploca sp. SIO2E9]|nr:DUF2817 domain-containing protein [Symploca sp. SIO2E9]
MLQSNVFSASYTIARNRFREAAFNLNANLESFAIDEKGSNDEELTIDFAFIGVNQPQWIVVLSSGLHGIEGFFGSAIQLAWMQEAVRRNELQIGIDGAILLIHAINPYGFAWFRRTNEDNIDLNRNFLLQNETYKDAPFEYSLINDFLNPQSPPPLIDPFLFIAIRTILRCGYPILKQAIAGGQYEFSEGLFFGGSSPAKSTQIIQAALPQWVSSAKQIIHLDFHTGLGKWANYELFPSVLLDPSRYTWVFRQFGLDKIAGRVPYKCQGLMGNWLANNFTHKNYVYLNAEFGTYSGLKALASLRAENRFHFYGKEDHKRVKAQLYEVFCPKASAWRQSSLTKGLALVNKALEVCPSMHENLF